MATRPRVSAMLETSLYVADLDRACAFYQRVFGFELFVHDGRMCALGVPGGQVLLLFHHGSTNSRPPFPAASSRRIMAAANCISVSPFRLASWPPGRSTCASTISRWRAGSNGRAAAPACISATPTGNSLEVATPGLWPNH